MPMYSPSSSGYSNVESLDPNSLRGSGQERHIPTSQVGFGPGGAMPGQMQMDWNKYGTNKNQLRNLIQNYDQGPVSTAMGGMMDQRRQDRLRGLSQAPQMSMGQALNRGVDGGIRQQLGTGMQQDMSALGQLDSRKQAQLQNLFGIGQATGRARATDVMARQGLRGHLSDMDQQGHKAMLDSEAGKALQSAMERGAYDSKMQGRRNMFGTLLGAGIGAGLGGPAGAGLGASLGGSAMGAYG